MDFLFGKIAVSRGCCSQDQVDRCVAIQSALGDGRPLGRILIDEGFLTEERHSELLVLQRKNVKSATPAPRKEGKAALLFGKLAVREGLLTAAEANHCLRLQGMAGERRSLGEIMVAQGYLGAAQVRELLGRQQKKIMNCPACRLSFTVLTITKAAVISCPRCRGPLADGKPGDSTRTDAEFSTRILNAPEGRPDSRIITPGTPRTAISCRICRKTFEGALDSTGRARCPHCLTSFVPRGAP